MSQRQADSHLELAGLAIDLATGATGLAGPKLTSLERSVLRRLAADRGRPVSRSQLLVDVWGYAPESKSRAVATTIARLRARLEDDPATPTRLLTVHGEGYLLPHDVPAPETPLLGLEKELTALVHWLSCSTGPLISIIGGGGTGKSTLLRHAHSHACRSMGDRFPGGVLAVDADELSNDLASRLRTATSTTGAVCFIDLQDHPPTSLGAELQDSLGSASARVVLATRAALDLRGEALLPLHGLKLCPEHMDLPPAARTPARHRSLEANRRSTLQTLPPGCLGPEGTLNPNAMGPLARAGLVSWDDAGEPQIPSWLFGDTQ